MAPTWKVTTASNNSLHEPVLRGQPEQIPAVKHGSNIHTFVIIVPAMFAISLLALVVYHHQQDTEMRAELESTRSAMTQWLNASEGRLARVQVELTATEKHLERAQQKLEYAQALAARLKSDLEKSNQELSQEISGKASATDLARLTEAASTQSAQIGAVSQNVGSVRTEVHSVKAELDRARQDLANLDGIISQHGILIATNAQGLEALRSRGERDYLEFDITKRQGAKSLGNVRIELRDTDSRRSRADIRIHVDDAKIDREISVNEPVFVKQGREQADYEIVINQVLKNRILGYVSFRKAGSLTTAASNPLH